LAAARNRAPAIARGGNAGAPCPHGKAARQA
jgi:hypothetical protein